MATAYTLEYGTLTFRKSYLTSLTLGTHAMSLVTAGGSADFSIVLQDSRNDNPMIANKTFDVFKPDDLTFEIDWGKGSFSSLELDGDALNEGVDYTLAGNTLTISKDYLSELEEDDYVFTLNTTTGATDFTVTVKRVGSRWLDEELLKVYRGSDVSFELYLDGVTVSSVKEGSTELEQTSYTYQDNVLTLKNGYLSTLSTGKYDLSVEVSDGDLFECSVLVNGISYEDGETGVIKSEKLYGIGFYMGDADEKISIIESGINGKSINANVPGGKTGFTFLRQNDAMVFRTDVLYKISFKAIVPSSVELIVKINDLNVAWLAQNNAIRTTDCDIDPRTNITKDENSGVITFEVYVLAESAAPNFEILYVTHANDAVDIIFDDFSIMETNLALHSAKASQISGATTVSFVKNSIDDVVFTVTNQGAVLDGLYRSGTPETKLSENDYTFVNNTLTIKKEYLKSFASGTALTLIYREYDPEVASRVFNTTITVNILSAPTEWASNAQKIVYYNGEAQKLGLLLGENVVNSFTVNGVAVDKNYVVKGDDGITVSNDYLKTLPTGANRVVITDSRNESFNALIYTGLSEGEFLYSDFDLVDISQTANGFGIQMNKQITSDIEGNSLRLWAGNNDGHIAVLEKNNWLPFANMQGNHYVYASFDFKVNSWTPGTDGNCLIVKFGNGGSDAAYIRVNEGKYYLVNGPIAYANGCSMTETNGIYHVQLAFMPNLTGTDVTADGTYQLQFNKYLSECDIVIDNLLVYVGSEFARTPVLAGDDLQYDKAASADVSISVNQNVSVFQGLYLKGTTNELISQENYTFENGVIVLKKEWLATFDAGTTVTVVYTACDPMDSQRQFTVEITVKVLLQPTVWASEAEQVKYANGESVEFGLLFGTNTVDHATVNETELAADKLQITQTGLTISKDLLSELGTGAFRFVITDSYGSTFRFLLYNNLENGEFLYSDADYANLFDQAGFGINSAKTYDSGVDGQGVRLQGSTMGHFVVLSSNAWLQYSLQRYHYTYVSLDIEVNSWTSPMVANPGGSTDDFCLVIRFDERGHNVAFVKQDAQGNYYLELNQVSTSGSSLTKISNNVYRLNLVFVPGRLGIDIDAENNYELQFCNWNSSYDVVLDNFLVYVGDKVESESSVYDFENDEVGKTYGNTDIFVNGATVVQNGNEKAAQVNITGTWQTIFGWNEEVYGAKNETNFYFEQNAWYKLSFKLTVSNLTDDIDQWDNFLVGRLNGDNDLFYIKRTTDGAFHNLDSNAIKENVKLEASSLVVDSDNPDTITAEYYFYADGGATSYQHLRLISLRVCTVVIDYVQLEKVDSLPTA